ncbi:hypothetical protein CP356_08080 [Lactobacillus sp. UMNPBX5]|nr:hypothetical protein CP356_08080 [Lactobacillus sp. UMNPBX5]
MKYLVDTADEFVETVSEAELIRWGEYFGIGIEMTLSEAIEALENVGYKVERLEEKENLECGENGTNACKKL